MGNVQMSMSRRSAKSGKLRTHSQVDLYDLLISGFIRSLEAEIPAAYDPYPVAVFAICYRYYIVPKFIFMYDHQAFHAINVTEPNHITFKKELLRTNDESTSWHRPFDLSCYIPNVLDVAPKITPFLNFEDAGSPKHTSMVYDGILSRAYSKVHESGESSRSLYVFENQNLHSNLITPISRRYSVKHDHSHHLLQSATCNQGRLLNHMTYCGDRWGISPSPYLDVYVHVLCRCLDCS